MNADNERLLTLQQTEYNTTTIDQYTSHPGPAHLLLVADVLPVSERLGHDPALRDVLGEHAQEGGLASSCKSMTKDTITSVTAWHHYKRTFS